MKAPAAKGPGRRSGGHRAAHTGGTTGGGKAKQKPFTRKQQRQFRQYIRHHPQKRTLVLNATNATVEEDVQFGRTKPYSPAENPRLVIERYLDASALPPPPAIVDRASKVTSWPMYCNGPDPANPPGSPDGAGDCTFATAGHEIQAWTAYAGIEQTIPPSAVIAGYSAITGYNPQTGANDNGANVQDVLNYWRKTGIGGHQIQGFAQLSGLDNLTLAKQCLDIFGTIYLGFNFPQSAMDQFKAGEPWSFVGDGNIIGGHAVPVQAWQTNVTGEIEVITWGKVQRMTRAFWRNYVEEAWVVFSNDWLTANAATIDGLNIAQLRADYQALTGQPPAF